MYLFVAGARLSTRPQIGWPVTTSRGGVLENILGLEDTIWSPWLWPRSLQVLENALSSARGQHYFLTCLKWPRSWPNFFRLKERQSLRKKFWRHFFSRRTLETCGKFTKFWSEDPFFVKSLPRCVLGVWPWPRDGLSSVGLSLALASDFFCVLGLILEPYGLDSTSDCKL